MLHMLHAKENGCKMIVVDPRFTRTAAKADHYVRIRSGTDIPFLFGVLYHIFKNGWEDKKYIEDRVYGMDKVREEVLAKWTPTRCSRPAASTPPATGGEDDGRNRPAPSWCMGQTQHTIGNAIVRASCMLQLALGNIGKSGGGTNIFRGHDNVQGATDVGPNPDSLPGYYGLAEGAWKHFAKSGAWTSSGSRSSSPPGDDDQIRHHGVALDRRRAREERADRPGQQPARRVLLGPCAELADARPGDEEGDGQARPAGRGRSLPSATAAMAAMPGKPEDLNPNRAVYLLPAATQFETSGSCTASNRSIQWRESHRAAVGEPHRPHDHVPVRAKLGQRAGQELQDGQGQGHGRARAEDILREINRRLDHRLHRPEPERLKAHMRTCTCST
jgi:formate dehydrogenase major subunit